MIPDEVEPAPRDHNRPPSPVESLVVEQKEALKVFEQRRDELVASAGKLKVFDRISAGSAGDVIRIAGEVFKRVDQDRRDRTDPYRKAADSAKAVSDEFWQPVEDALKELRRRLKVWTDAEDAKIEAQQREQDAEMERMRQASLPKAPEPHVSTDPVGANPPSERQDINYSATAPRPAAPPVFRPAARRKIRGDLGATVSTVERKEYRVSDITKVPPWILDTPTVHDAIVAVVKSMAKHMGEIPGIESTTVTDNKIL